VDLRTVLPHGLALSLARLMLLMAAAAGFLAMHGLAATDPAGIHHYPLSMSATSTADPARATGDEARDLASAPMVMNSAHDCGSDCHDMAAACLFVLLGTLAAVTLRALHKGLAGTGPAALRTIWQRCSPARSPPHPVFLVLCVFRL
jgi:hypothetical protein